jgi:hypothetical protein
VAEIGQYHYYVWANYYWVEYQYTLCNVKSCVTYHEWHLNHWSGALTDTNPNADKNGSTIGLVAYSPPAFDTNPNHEINLNQQKTYTRQSGQYRSYSFSLSMAGFVGLTDVATYGSVTSMTWNKGTGCSSGTDYLWGNGTDPGAADIVQASCI